MPAQRTAFQTAAIAMAAAAMLGAAATAGAAEPVIGLITKTDTNPFFVKMKEGATAAAKAKATSQPTSRMASAPSRFGR